MYLGHSGILEMGPRPLKTLASSGIIIYPTHVK